MQSTTIYYTNCEAAHSWSFRIPNFHTKWQHFSQSGMRLIYSLVPRPSHCQVFDDMQKLYAINKKKLDSEYR